MQRQWIRYFQIHFLLPFTFNRSPFTPLKDETQGHSLLTSHLLFQKSSVNRMK